MPGRRSDVGGMQIGFVLHTNDGWWVRVMTIRKRRDAATWLLISLSAVGLPCAGATESPPERETEYAIRWEAVPGAPQTDAAVASLLADATSDGGDDYEVKYFDITPPNDAPKGATAILRQRRKNGKKYELTFKYRSAAPIENAKCPLPEPSETKNEVDVSVAGGGDRKRTYSFSCTSESKSGPPPIPDGLHAHATPCTISMHRRKLDTLKVKVELWRIPGSVPILEASRGAPDDPGALESFEREVAGPLERAGAKPTDRSKTELGSTCSASE